MTGLQPCGTHAAYMRHLRRGEKPCKACREARRAYAAEQARKSRAKLPVAECSSCSKERPILRYGWCESCCTRWYRAGRPEGGPPPPRDPREASARARAAQAEARREDYLFLLGTGEIPEMAAQRVGVSVRRAREVYAKAVAR